MTRSPHGLKTPNFNTHRSYTMQKQSNFTAPRSMSEASWFPSCDPIERPEQKPRTHWRTAAWLVVVALCLIALAAVRHG